MAGRREVSGSQYLRPRLRLTRGWLIRLLGSAVLLGIVLALLPLEDVGAAFAALPVWIFLAVLALFLAGHAAAAGKWWALMGAPGAYLLALRAHLAGLAANLCLPGVAGGDVVRAALMIRGGAPGGAVTAAALADRLIDMLALALLAGAGLAMLPGGGGAAVLIRIGIVLAVALTGAFVIAPRLIPAVLARMPGLPGAKLLAGLGLALRDLTRRPARLALALALSLSVQTGFIMLFIWLAGAAGVAAPAGAWVFAWPLAKILAVLPVSLGGIGLREASLAALMAPFGAAAPGVVAASLVWQAVLAAAGVLGAAIWALSARAAAPPVPAVRQAEG